MRPTPRYPEARMNACGVSADAFSIAVAAGDALHRIGVPKEERDAFYKEVLQVDRDHTLMTAMLWVTVEWIEPDDRYDDAGDDE